MAESIATGTPAAEIGRPAAVSAAHVEVPALARDATKLGRLIAGVVAPVTLLSALAYYFGWRRERAFAGYFGIDPSVLGLSAHDYVLRSVDALFLPFAWVLLVAFSALVLHVLVGARLTRMHAGPFIFAAGLAALAVGVALGAGHGVSGSYVYLQALAPAVGVLLVAYALGRAPGTRVAPTGAALAALRLVTLAVVLVSLFWATAEYADSRGFDEARTLGARLEVNPAVTVFSKVGLNISPSRYGGAAAPCVVVVERSAGSGYPYEYDGFTLLVRSGGKYFVTPTPVPPSPWNPTADPVLVLPDDESIRIELQTGRDYPHRPVEKLASGAQPAFTC